MAATGEEAAAMDSISRVPMAHPMALNLAGVSDTQAEAAAAPENATENLIPAPKKPSTNSECRQLAALVV